MKYTRRLKKRVSLSAQDREALERSKQAAAQQPRGGEQEANVAAGGSVAASAVGNHAVHHMEVDELERELSGRA